MFKTAKILPKLLMSTYIVFLLSCTHTNKVTDNKLAPSYPRHLNNYTISDSDGTYRYQRTILSDGKIKIIQRSCVGQTKPTAADDSRQGRKQIDTGFSAPIFQPTKIKLFARYSCIQDNY